MSVTKSNSGSRAYIITGPTAGVGRATALKMAKLGTLVLVGRNSSKLDEVKKAVERVGGNAVTVVCDMSDLASVRRASAEIIALNGRIYASTEFLRSTTVSSGPQPTRHLAQFVRQVEIGPYLKRFPVSIH